MPKPSTYEQWVPQWAIDQVIAIAQQTIDGKSGMSEREFRIWIDTMCAPAGRDAVYDAFGRGRVLSQEKRRKQ